MTMTMEKIQISPKLMDYELRLMKTESRHTKIRRVIFKSIHKFAVLFKLKRIERWSYLKWFNTYSYGPLAIWKFAEDYLNCDLIGD